jgi:hypothetical protein
MTTEESKSYVWVGWNLERALRESRGARFVLWEDTGRGACATETEDGGVKPPLQVELKIADLFRDEQRLDDSWVRSGWQAHNLGWRRQKKMAA